MTCETISNVRITDRTVQETILLYVHGAQRGHPRAFLPAAGFDGRRRISVPLLRLMTNKPTGKAADVPRRVHIELQDDMMNDIRVLVENDRLLVPKQSYSGPFRRWRQAAIFASTRRSTCRPR